MKRLIATLVLSLLISVMSYADNDPMVSLFKFQSQMAAQGNVEAIMKLGEMYEQGQGTRRDLNKALEMYEKAQAQGHADAVKAIRRIEKIKKQDVRKLEIERKKKLAHEKLVREKAAREKAVRAKAARDEAMREKAAREKIVREKVAEEKALRERMAKEKAEREKQAIKKAAREKAEKAAKMRRQQNQREELPGMGWDEEDDEDEGDDGDETTGIKPAAKNVKQVARQEKPAAKDLNPVARKAKLAAKELKPVKNVKQGSDDEGFSSNPCATPAGRFMATCRKRQ